MSGLLPWLPPAALAEMRRIHEQTLTELALQRRAAPGPDSPGLADFAANVPMSIFPTPAYGDLANVNSQVLGGGRTGYTGFVRHSQDVAPSDTFVLGGRTFVVRGVGKDWPLMRPLALEELAG